MRIAGGDLSTLRRELERPALPSLRPWRTMPGPRRLLDAVRTRAATANPVGCGIDSENVGYDTPLVLKETP